MMKFIRINVIFSMIMNPLSIAIGVLTTIFWHTPIIFLIFSVVYGTVITWTVGSFALKETQIAKDKKELKKIGIFTLIGNNPLAGILMLTIKNEQLPANWNKEKNVELHN